jgi:hypothetical protein
MNNNIETVIDTNLIIAEALENDEYETTYEEVEAQTEVPTKQENFFYRTFGVHDPFNAAFLIIIFLIIISIAITILRFAGKILGQIFRFLRFIFRPILRLFGYDFDD